MVKELIFNRVTDRLPDNYGDMLVFFEHQPMSFVGHYNISDNRWYILDDDDGSYNTDEDCGMVVEFWADFPTNF